MIATIYFSTKVTHPVRDHWYHKPSNIWLSIKQRIYVRSILDSVIANCRYVDGQMLFKFGVGYTLTHGKGRYIDIRSGERRKLYDSNEPSFKLEIFGITNYEAELLAYDLLKAFQQDGVYIDMRDAEAQFVHRNSRLSDIPKLESGRAQA